MSQKQVLQLYKSLIRESKKFPAYNFRNYAVRKVRDSFKENKHLTDQNAVNDKINEARRNLEIIKRQVLIGEMYSTDTLVIENLAVRK